MYEGFCLSKGITVQGLFILICGSLTYYKKTLHFVYSFADVLK